MLLCGEGMAYDQGCGGGGDVKKTSFGGFRIVAVVVDILRRFKKMFLQVRNTRTANMDSCMLYVQERVSNQTPGTRRVAFQYT